MSSKFEISDRMPSGPEKCDEEWLEEDFEDFEPERSGGESGGLIVVVISLPRGLVCGVNDRVCGSAAALIVTNMFSVQC